MQNSHIVILTIAIHVRSLKGAVRDMVATIRERLSLKQHLVADKYNLNKLVDLETRKEYQVDVTNRVLALESLEIASVVKIRDSIKASAKEKVRILETNRNKPWFHEECSELANKRKQTKITLATESKQPNCRRFQ